MKRPRTDRLSIRVPAEIKRALAAIATTRDVELSDVARELLRDGLDRAKSATDARKAA